MADHNHVPVRRPPEDQAAMEIWLRQSEQWQFVRRSAAQRMSKGALVAELKERVLHDFGKETDLTVGVVVDAVCAVATRLEAGQKLAAYEAAERAHPPSPAQPEVNRPPGPRPNARPQDRPARKTRRPMPAASEATA